MQNIPHLTFTTKVLEKCGCDKSAVIYSLLPLIDEKPEYMKGTYSHCLENQPKLIDSALEIFTGKKLGAAKNSYEYTRIKEEKESFFNLFSRFKNITNLPSKISTDKIEAALASLSHIYLDTIFNPVQFFIPHSSSCSGQWQFWNDINYFELKEKLNQKEFIFSLREKLDKSKIWDIKFEPEEFPLIIKKRLLKEKAFGKKFDPESMIKALIIRIGEIAKPDVNYEIIDFSIRSFFTYLAIKKYSRVDREIEFLRRFEKEIINILK